jgi:hypothetical protein
MTHACCPHCRLRFTPAAAGYLAACPECDQPLQRSAGLEATLGFRLFSPRDLPHPLPQAAEVSNRVPEPEGRF